MMGLRDRAWLIRGTGALLAALVIVLGMAAVSSGRSRARAHAATALPCASVPVAGPRDPTNPLA